MTLDSLVAYAKFQSRNRDAFHFRSISRPRARKDSVFQSRNRDAFHFRTPIPASPNSSMRFQSRNRDAFHFRTLAFSGRLEDSSFNLVIEMLFISGSHLKLDAFLGYHVSIS